MELLVNGQKVSAELVDGRYVYTFTPDQDLDSVALASTCIGETELKRIQVEMGDKMTGFVVPGTIQGDESGVFRSLREINLLMTDTENSSLWSRIRLNTQGMLQQYHRDHLSTEITQTANGIATAIRDELNGYHNQAMETARGLEREIKDREGAVNRVIEQVDGFSRQLTSHDERLSSTITQLPGLIDQRVNKDKIEGFISNAGDAIVTAVRDKGTDLMSAINLAPEGVTIQGGRINLDGATFTKQFTAEVAKLIEVQADHIVGGTLDAAKANIINLNADSITGLDAKLQSADIIDAVIKNMRGKRITALNDAMTIDLTEGQLLFYSDEAALKRVVRGYPTQFVKFTTGTSGYRNVGVTIIGSNRSGTESSNDGGFVGVRFWNGAYDDSVDIVGDKVRLASSAYNDSDGWEVITTPGSLKIAPHRSVDYRSSEIHVGNIYLYHEGASRSLFEIIKMFNTSLRDLGGTYYTSDALLN